jgi:hypothetical protein
MRGTAQSMGELEYFSIDGVWEATPTYMRSRPGVFLTGGAGGQVHAANAVRSEPPLRKSAPAQSDGKSANAVEQARKSAEFWRTLRLSGYFEE